MTFFYTFNHNTGKSVLTNFSQLHVCEFTFCQKSFKSFFEKITIFEVVKLFSRMWLGSARPGQNMHSASMGWKTLYRVSLMITKLIIIKFIFLYFVIFRLGNKVFISNFLIQKKENMKYYFFKIFYILKSQ